MTRNAGRTCFFAKGGQGDAGASRLRLAKPSDLEGLAASLLHLQRTAGNLAAGRLLGTPGARLRDQLRIGQPGDAFEREADRVADAMVGATAPRGELPGFSQMQSSGGGALRREAPCETPRVPAGFTVQLAGLRGSGAPLSSAQRSFFEPRFGHDFGAVRLHTGALAERSAEAVRARAFTLGNDVVFGRGEYAPDSPAGRHLLAHELTHVVQQTPTVVRRQPFSPNAGNQTSLLAGLGTESRLDRRSTLPYRQAVELQECIHIMGEASVEYCREKVLGEKPKLAAWTLAWPVKVEGSSVSSCYGSRPNPDKKKKGQDFHPGLDIAQAMGQPVFAAASGEVILAGPVGGYGPNYVAIQHTERLITGYGHMKSKLVKPFALHAKSQRETVAKGQQIGTVGNEGTSFGSHLHFNVTIAKDPVDKYIWNGDVDPLQNGLSIPDGVPNPNKCS